MFKHKSQKEKRKEVFELVRLGLITLKDEERNSQKC